MRNLQLIATTVYEIVRLATPGLMDPTGLQTNLKSGGGNSALDSKPGEDEGGAGEGKEGKEGREGGGKVGVDGDGSGTGEILKQGHFKVSLTGGRTWISVFATLRHDELLLVETGGVSGGSGGDSEGVKESDHNGTYRYTLTPDMQVDLLPLSSKGKGKWKLTFGESEEGGDAPGGAGVGGALEAALWFDIASEVPRGGGEKLRTGALYANAMWRFALKQAIRIASPAVHSSSFQFLSEEETAAQLLPTSYFCPADVLGLEWMTSQKQVLLDWAEALLSELVGADAGGRGGQGMEV
jgi:hypothetical protein